MINEIELGGEKRPSHFGVNALYLYSELTDVPIHKMLVQLENLTFAQMINLIWAGLKAGAIHEKKEFTAEISDVGGWLDQDFMKFEECVSIMRKTLPQAKKK